MNCSICLICFHFLSSADCAPYVRVSYNPMCTATIFILLIYFPMLFCNKHFSFSYVISFLCAHDFFIFLFLLFLVTSFLQCSLTCPCVLLNCCSVLVGSFEQTDHRLLVVSIVWLPISPVYLKHFVGNCELFCISIPHAKAISMVFVVLYFLSLSREERKRGRARKRGS